MVGSHPPLTLYLFVILNIEVFQQTIITTNKLGAFMEPQFQRFISLFEYNSIKYSFQRKVKVVLIFLFKAGQVNEVFFFFLDILFFLNFFFLM